MINLKIDPEFQSQIPPLTDDEFKQLEENAYYSGAGPLLTATTVMPFSRGILRFIFPLRRSNLRTAKKPLRGFAGISWDGET